MKHIVVSNAAGTFSTILKYLSWMEVSGNADNNIKVYLHHTNKTNYNGNCLPSEYMIVTGNDSIKNEYIKNDTFLNIFDKNSNIFTIKDITNENFIIIEEYPRNFLDYIKNYPESLNKDPRGGIIGNYFDTDYLNLVRYSLNKQWLKFRFNQLFEAKLKYEIDKVLPANKKILCAMVRYAQHYVGWNQNYDSILNEIVTQSDEYDYVLVVTICNSFLKMAKNSLGDKCIFFDRERLDDYSIDWKGGRGEYMTDLEYQKEVEDCIVDVIAASKCDKIISGASNMLMGALIFNPTINFNIFNTLKTSYGA